MVFALIGNFGTWEIILILFVALLVFGPGKLPEVAKTIGKTLGDIRKYTSGVQKEFQDAINLEGSNDTGKNQSSKKDDKTEVIAIDAHDVADEKEETAVETMEGAGEDVTGFTYGVKKPVAGNEVSLTVKDVNSHNAGNEGSES